MFEVAPVRDAQQRMKQTRVADIDLGRLDLALADVFEPRRQLPHHEHAGHQVKVTTHSRFFDRQCTAKLGGIPHLTWKWATMVQNLCNVMAGMVMPNCEMSRSKNICRNWRRHE